MGGRVGAWALAMGAALVGCDGAAEVAADAAVDAGAPDAAPDALAALAAGEVRYVLAWDDTGLDPLPDGAWRVTNDLGQTFTLTRGWLTSYSSQLVPCWLVEGTARSVGGWLWSLVGGVAHAGHDDEPDPSLFEVPHVEALLDRSTLVLGTVAGVPPETYCKAFYLVARSDDTAVGVPDAVPYDRVSLYLEGTWEANGETHALSLSTDLNIGRNLDLMPADGGDAPLRLDPSEAGVEVVVYRRIAGWFDGLDLAALDDETALARALMPKIVASLRAEVR